MPYFVLYLIVINVLSFLWYGIDKYWAKHHKWRIKEKDLWLMAFLGGSLGSFLGMFIFKHKTRKIKFYLWNSIMLGIWFYIIYKYLMMSGYLF